MKKAALVFVPSPGIGHLVSMTELAKRLLDREKRLAITVLVITPPATPTINEYIKSLVSSDSRIRYINLPHVDPPASHNPQEISVEKFISDFIQSHRPHVKDAIVHNVLTSASVPLVALVVDLFCTSMIDVANELKVPSYLFFTSSAAFLGLMRCLSTHRSHIGAEFSPSDPEFIIPSYAGPVPASVLPSVLFNKRGGCTSFLNHGERFKETKGMIVNTFSELEYHAVNSFVARDEADQAVPPAVYTVGPLLDLKGRKHIGSDPNEIIIWLVNQPPSSVVFLCFGSLGSFNPPQLGQIAVALEHSGQRFLWSIRKPPPKDTGEVVMANEIESAITRVMDETNPVRKRVKEMAEKSRKAYPPVVLELGVDDMVFKHAGGADGSLVQVIEGSICTQVTTILV
ncbi:hypothetical protein RJ639_021111 [Escallonia herrerae]|uniref:Uncharacterized protein n=1 Tax=Escallonia herrerae TaxID=1293975 RepID=A0AA89AF79_9ASTE|nr:hypothetical protein RJ639_021111 [Escallonia herrerae]